MKKHKQTILPLLMLVVLLLVGLCDRVYAEESAQYPYLTSFEMVDVDFFSSPKFNTGKDGTPIGVEWKNYPDGPQKSVNKTECDYVLGEIKVYTNGVPTGNVRKRKAYVTPVYTLANSDLITQYATASGKQATNIITAGNSTTATTRSDIICFTTADGTKYGYNLTVLDGSDQPIETPTEITLESIAVNRTAEDTATIYIKSNVAGTYYYAVTEADEGPSFDETAETTALRRYANTIQLTGLTAGAKKLHILAKSEGLDNVTVSFDVPKFAVAHSLSASTSLIWEDQGDKDGNRKGNVVFTNQSGTPITTAFAGETVTATAEPRNTGGWYEFAFEQWKDETGIELTKEQRKTNKVTFKMPDADVTLFAEFKNVGTTVTWGSTPNGAPAIKVNGNTRDTQYVYRTGSTAEVNFNGTDWQESWVFLGWEIMINGENRADDPEYVTYPGVAANPHVVLAGDNVTITAKFRSKIFAAVTAKADPATMGSAAVSVGGGDPVESKSVVFEGQTVTLTAAPGDRYTLKRWEVKDADGTEIAVTKDPEDTNKATFTMPDSGLKITATAIFDVDPAKASTDCVLEDVDLKITGATVENQGPSYTVTVPANTDEDTLSAAVLKFTISEYADIIRAGDETPWPTNGQACGMTLDTPVTFTVRSEKCRLGGDDAAKAEYTITVVRAKSTQCAIDSAKLGNVDGVVDQTGKTVTFTVPADTEDSAVATMPLTFTCSQYASIKLKDAEADWINDTACGMKLNEEKTFVVTAEDGTTTAEYTVVIHRAPSDKKALTGATLGDIAAVIDEDDHAVTFTVPADTTDSTLGEMILKFTCSPRAAVKLKDAEDNWPAAGLRSGLKLGVPATFVVTAENGDTQEYTVTVNREKSTEKAITEAVLTKTGGASVKADISEQNKTVTFTLPVGTTDADVAAMTLKFTCSQYASIKLENAGDNWPAGGQLCGMKLNETKTFVVTAENGDTQAYTVLIVRGKSSAKEITNALLLAKAGDTTSPATVKIDNAKKTIDFTLPAGSDTSKLGEMILKLTVSDYATVKKSGDTGNWPAEGKACGMELNKAATFTVTAESGSTQDYTVTITRTKSTTKDITAVKLLDADKSVIAEGKLNGTTWTITLPSDTDKALINKIGTSTDVFMQINYTGVSLAQAEGYDDATGTIGKWSSGNVMCGVSPNSSKTFTVTAEDGSTKEYTVEIKYTAPNAPTLSNGSATRTSKTGATVKFTSSEAGNYFYKVVDHGAAVPTVDTSKSGTAAVKGENTITLSNLTEDARDIYIVVVNASRGESAALKIEIPAYGGGTETPDTGKFTITANAPKGGTITTNRTKADKGDEIIVTVTPDSGYQMVEGSLSYSLAVAGGETVKITGNRFTMPGGNVTITCKWETATTTVKGITSFSINGVAGAVNNTTNTITITMPRGTDVTKLTPAISTNGVKSLTPGSGETVNFTNSVTYTATMEDGSTKTYTVTVYVDKGTLADQFWDKLTDFVNQVPWWQYAEKQQSTSKYPKYW